MNVHKISLRGSPNKEIVLCHKTLRGCSIVLCHKTHKNEQETFLIKFSLLCEKYEKLLQCEVPLNFFNKNYVFAKKMNFGKCELIEMLC